MERAESLEKIKESGGGSRGLALLSRKQGSKDGRRGEKDDWRAR